MKPFFALTLAAYGAMAFADVIPVNPHITPHDPLPHSVLSCGGAIVTDVGPRLEGVPDSGSTALLNNGGASVSYDVVSAIQNTQIGDHVLVCLVFVPKNCPVGDHRGKIYTITNLRTLESWTLPDSEHSCGGA